MNFRFKAHRRAVELGVVGAAERGRDRDVVQGVRRERRHVRQVVGAPARRRVVVARLRVRAAPAGEGAVRRVGAGAARATPLIADAVVVGEARRDGGVREVGARDLSDRARISLAPAAFTL